MIDAERLATSVTVELIAAGAQHLAAGTVGTRAHFEDCDARAVWVDLFQWKAFEKRFADGAGCGSENAFHDS